MLKKFVFFLKIVKEEFVKRAQSEHKRVGNSIDEKRLNFLQKYYDFSFDAKSREARYLYQVDR